MWSSVVQDYPQLHNCVQDKPGLCETWSQIQIVTTTKSNIPASLQNHARYAIIFDPQNKPLSDRELGLAQHMPVLAEFKRPEARGKLQVQNQPGLYSKFQKDPLKNTYCRETCIQVHQQECMPCLISYISLLFVNDGKWIILVVSGNSFDILTRVVVISIQHTSLKDF